jgi:Zn-dependent M28 family amino/carboxypeptidase
VIEVKSLKEVQSLGDRARGAIIFYNRPMDPTSLNTFHGYGAAVDQRSRGAIEAARAGAVGTIVRSVTLAHDDVPHTGSMSYEDSVQKIPAVAVSTRGADSLSRLLNAGGVVRVRMRLSARTLPDAPSGNVLGEIPGTELPDEIVVVGGHLDAWDKGHGAHDNGAGCMQSIEALDLLNRVGFRPRRTIRAVMFMNEENGLRGGKAYAAAPARAQERHVAAIEADRGGFAPRSLSVDADSATVLRLARWSSLFAELGAGRIFKGGSGVDIGPLVSGGVPGVGLVVEDHRYFDYHHSANDTIDAVHPRELESGAIVVALLAAILANQ